MNEETKTLSAPEKARPPLATSSLLRPVVKRWRRFYGPFGRVSARLLDYLTVTDVRRRRASLVLAVAVNLIVLTLLSTFARVRIWIPNAPSDTIQVTLVETLPFDLPLRDPELQPEPEPEVIEPEPEIVEELEPEPEPEPDPVPDPVEPAAPAPEPEPQPEPQLNLNSDPQFAPPADAPEPLIPDPAPGAEDDLTLPEPQDEPLAPVEEAEEPLITEEDEASQTAGLEDILGEEAADGDDEAEELETEPDLVEAPSGDDMFDEEPVFGRRTFVLPKVALPAVDAEGKPLPEGAAAILPGDSGVVAIFCPEQFSNEDKQKECAGRTEIRSGWRPGASGEDWSRATELLKRDRTDGVAGPTIGPVAAEIESRRQDDLIRDLRDPRRSDPGVNDLPDAGDDNIMRGVEGNRPAIGPNAFEPSWTLRDRPDSVSKKDLEELERQIREAEDGN